MSVVERKLSLAIGLGFCWGGYTSQQMGELNFFKLKSKLNYFHLVSGGFGVPSGACCSKLKKTFLHQLHHSRAGSPSE